MVPMPLRRPAGELSMDSDHQVKKVVDPSGGVIVARHRERISCHVLLEKAQPGGGEGSHHAGSIGRKRADVEDHVVQADLLSSIDLPRQGRGRT